MTSRPVLFLLDGHGLAYRHHFAMITRPFTTSSGEITSAVFGFTRTLMDILEKDKPYYLAVAFDEGLSGRDALYPEYKGTRDKMPDELSSQMPRIQEVVRAFNIPILSLPGYEADDMMGQRRVRRKNWGWMCGSSQATAICCNCSPTTPVCA
jgi:DNA polymerase-1